ncbi:MAG TPA: hypothetical protein VFX49_03940 [Chloroflexota bacterium]|nr:hypothetical protein [Chloroflexota bacterium]
MSDYTLKLWVQCQILLESAKANLRKLEQGQGMVEYALVMTLVSIAAIAVLTTLGTNIIGRVNQVIGCLDTDLGTACP